MKWRRAHGHRSLGLRLVTLFGLLALAVGAVVIGGTERLLRFGYGGVVQPLLSDYVDRLAAEIGSPPSVEAARALEARLPVRVQIEGPSVQYDGRPYGQRHRQDEHARHGEGGERYEAGSILTRRSADGHTLRFGIAPEVWRDRPRAMGWWMLALLLAALALAYHAVRRLFRPIDDIAAGAQRYGSGDFATPIPVRRRDELGALAQQVNRMAAELRRMLDSKRALLLAISHELRSPLTRARLNAELLGEAAAGAAGAMGAAASPIPEREALLQDLEEMRRLIEQLLEHERLAGGHQALHREHCDVAALLDELLDESFPDAGLEWTLAPDLGQAAIDPARLKLALRNLIANALRHGQAAASDGAAQALHGPLLSARREGDQLVLQVRDFGPGVPPDQLGRLAEPFYRPDSARGRASGGVGLGLALARMVAQAHGGELELANAAPGLAATLRLPAAPAPQGA